MSVVVIIPARLAATRLPNKPLALIAGQPMVWHVARRAAQAQNVSRVLIATPDAAIFDAVTALGGEAVRTSDAHRSGTDRVAEAASHLSDDCDIIVNVQGDEPLIDPATIDAAIDALRGGDAATHSPGATTIATHSATVVMATVSCPLPAGRESDPDVVKVVCDRHGYALYFSRSPLPFQRDAAPFAPRQHVGLYAYRRDFLARFPQMEPTPLEKAESLEQLRVLENGYRIRVVQTTTAPESVDTPDDLARVRRLMET